MPVSWTRCFAGLLASLWIAGAGAAVPEKRVALLIGNNTYPTSPLRNAVNDARVLGAALAQLGFGVTVRENLSRRELIEAVRLFGDAMQGADAAVFFYAGHALQFKDRNFLVPVDAEIVAEEDIALFALDLAAVFDRMERARTRHNLIILDACRDNPFAGTFKLASTGLAQASAPPGTLIAYATAPGSVASDGGFGKNGVYTKHILQQVTVPDQPVEIMFKRVREGVEKETAFRQTPWDASSLKGDFSFNASGRSVGGAAPPAPAPGPSVDVQLQIELEFWKTVRESNRREELQAYLDHYPHGKFVTLAKLKLGALPAGAMESPRTRSWRAAPLAMAAAAPLAVAAMAAPAAMSPVAPLAMQAMPLAQVAAPAGPPSVEDLFRPAQLADMQLSPDGKYVAALSPVGGRQNLVVLEVGSRKAHAVSGFRDVDAVWFRWVNGKRLIVQTGDAKGQQGGSRGGAYFGTDLEGRDVKKLSAGFEETLARGQVVFRPMQFLRTLPGGGDDVVAQEWVFDQHELRLGDVFRLNTRTGRRVSLIAGKPESAQVEQWIVDRRGVGRVQVVQRDGKEVVHYREGEGKPWRKLGETPIGEPGWTPIAIAEDDLGIYVSSWKDRDKAAIRLLDPAEGGVGRMVASHPYVDVTRLIFDEGVPVGIAYEADRPSVAWFDEELERIQAAVDAVLPRSTNEIQWSRNREVVLVKSSSDTWPGSYYLFDRKTGRLEWFVDTHPWLKRDALSPMRPVRYRARDGLEIPAYLTLPRKASGRLPLVVLVHGGPWTEGVGWRYDPEVQYLASRGYAVLQPNFRGTMRYGWKHLRASFKQWGRAMQDDLADGVAWAVAQGHADPGRVCIFGSSYGGYAALMGAADPGRYKCAISMAGIGDLPSLFRTVWSLQSRMEMAQHTMRELIGDPDREADDLAAVSPRRQAARIGVPVLLAHGTDDFIVPFSQAQEMRAALEDQGKPHRWMPLSGEGHGVRDPRNQSRFYGAVEEFLKEHIGRAQ